ncbi:MAG: hypothetical protein IJH36_03245 [Clostridia bacterium]|nr:hypothetical protein [Clostridia bacterium]MBQ3462117.1 hypothetical protein [Clostridia bacterium]MBQ3472239.1 hypothetical protein [Clostridia bacterium]MBR0470968.1 hypothetical protein [Clostridia bacterium]
MSTICWQCGKACGGCAWSDGLKPVEGWKIQHIKLASGDKIHVTACPEFVRDGMNHTPYKREKTPKGTRLTEQEMAYICLLRRQGKTYKEMSKMTGRTTDRIRRILRLKGLTKPIRQQRNVTPEVRQEILRLYAMNKDVSHQSIAEAVGFSQTTVSKVLREAYR